MAHVGMAEVLYERNELAAARDHATQGVTLCRQLAFTAPLAAGLAVLARIKHAQGEPAEAMETMGEAGQIELSPQVIALLDVQRARLLLVQGNVRAAAQWAKALGLSPTDEPDYPREQEYLVLSRLLLAENNPGPAVTLLQRLLEAAASQDRTGSLIEIQALLALALAGNGDRDRALVVLTQAVVLGGPPGYVRVFADEGAPMRALLAELRAAWPDERNRIDPGYLDALVRACGQADDVSPPARVPAAPTRLAEPLTDRELDVLRLIAAGKSNQRIAHDLFVALDTVKKHVSHILSKLGAVNRTEAVALARQLGLIP
jgi:LuxR family transcriptional regulator, maltose regulon positive regulatory protein